MQLMQRAHTYFFKAITGLILVQEVFCLITALPINEKDLFKKEIFLKGNFRGFPMRFSILGGVSQGKHQFPLGHRVPSCF